MSHAKAADSGPSSTEVLLFGGVAIGIDFSRAFQRWAELSGSSPRRLAEAFSFDEPYRQHETGDIRASEYFEALRRSLDIELADEQLADGWNRIYLAPVSGIEEILDWAAKRWPLYAFTNSNPTHQQYWSREYA